MAILASSCILTCARPIAARCSLQACQRQTSPRSQTVPSASHENSSLIERKEEKQDAKWRLWASNKESFHSGEMAIGLQLKAERLVAGLPAGRDKLRPSFGELRLLPQRCRHSEAAFLHAAPAGCDDAHRGWFPQ